MAKIRSIEMYLVIHNNQPDVAYPRKLMAEVRRSGYSKPQEIQIIKGLFIPDKPSATVATKED